MKGCVLGVAALVEHAEVGLLGRHDADEGLVAVVALTEVSTKTALTCMDRLHKNLPINL